MPDEQIALMPPPERSNVVHVAKRNGLLLLLASPYTWMVLGLLSVAFTEPLRDAVLKRHNPSIPVTEAPAAPKPLKHEDPFVRFIDLGAYVLEHLGAVIFVAMLVRLAIEKRAQEEAVKGVSDAVNEEVKKAFVDVNSQIDFFNKKVNEVNASLSNVDSRLSTIQVMTGGSLYAQKLKPADRQEIATTFLDPLFFRPSYDLTVKLTPKEQDLINVQIEIDSKLQNISKQPQALIITAFLDNVLFQQGATNVATGSKFHRFEFGPDTAAGHDFAQRQPFILSHGENHKFVKTVGDNVVFEYDPKIDIPMKEIYFVKMYAEQQMRMSDLFVWIMQVATENFNIRVYLEGNLTTDNFSVVARPMHHGQHRSFAAKPEGEKKLSWCIENVVLPYQGIQLWWSPKPAAPGTATRSGSMLTVDAREPV